MSDYDHVTWPERYDPKTSAIYALNDIVVEAPGPPRPANSALRAREYLTPSEIEKLVSAARCGRHGDRDATLILVAYRHGLRASEIADLEWSQVEFGRAATLHVRRVKAGNPSAHPLRATRCGRCASCAASFPIRRLCSPPSAAARSRPTPSTD